MIGMRAGIVLVAVLLAGCEAEADRPRRDAGPAPVVGSPESGRLTGDADSADSRPVTLAFAGDMHFELHLVELLDRPRGALGPISRTLSSADLSMVNLESAVTERGTPEAKELEDPGERFHFRTSAAALDVLAEAGVDVVTVANNHGADYGPAGVADTLRAKRHRPVAVVGIGRDRRDAFTPHRVTVRDTTFAFFGADASFLESVSSVWAAGPTTPGLAAAHADRPRALLAAVSSASRQGDVVVVYLHWGEELQACPTDQQRTMAKALSNAGADIVVGTHAHVQLGSGWIGNTYVNYGLGNFLWYHDHQPESGVLRIRVKDGKVVGDSWVPARIQADGRPLPLEGPERSDAIADWRRLRGCTDLASHPDEASLPPYSWSSERIGPWLRQRMRFSHRPGCPVPLADLRYLQMSYIDFDGRPDTGEMAIHKDHAEQVASVFRRLYDARWPIRRMRLVDEYGGNDNLSMAANNTSGFNCRRVAGSRAWSAHAFGAAIDINPVQNPDLSGGTVAPQAGHRFATVDRSSTALLPAGVIHENDVVVRAFAEIGWSWGGHWTSPKDYQHFSARAP